MDTARSHVLNEAEVADRLGLHVVTLRRWRSQGRGPDYVRMGRRIGYLPEAIDRYLGRHTVNPEGA